MAVFDELDDDVEKLTEQINEMKDEMGVDQTEHRRDDASEEEDDDDDSISPFMKEIKETKQLIEQDKRSEAIKRYSELALTYRKKKVEDNLSEDEKQGIQMLHDELDTAKETNES